MIIPCIRCGKAINSPNATNADYVTADEFILSEPREVRRALIHNPATRTKEAQINETVEVIHLVTKEVIGTTPKTPGLAIADNEFDSIEVESIADAARAYGRDYVKTIATMEDRPVQKTAIVCPDCFNPVTDRVIWGKHKAKK